MLCDEPVSSLLRAWRCWQPSLGVLARPRAKEALPPDPEPVRLAMAALATELHDAAPSRLAAAIATRRDIAGLWSLRVGLMQALAVAHGEAAARRRISDLDAVFLRCWPAAPVRQG